MYGHRCNKWLFSSQINLLIIFVINLLKLSCFVLVVNPKISKIQWANPQNLLQKLETFAFLAFLTIDCQEILYRHSWFPSFHLVFNLFEGLFICLILQCGCWFNLRVSPPTSLLSVFHLYLSFFFFAQFLCVIFFSLPLCSLSLWQMCLFRG